MSTARFLLMGLTIVLLLVAGLKVLRGKGGAALGLAAVVVVLAIALILTEPVDR